MNFLVLILQWSVRTVLLQKTWFHVSLCVYNCVPVHDFVTHTERTHTRHFASPPLSPISFHFFRPTFALLSVVCCIHLSVPPYLSPLNSNTFLQHYSRCPDSTLNFDILPILQSTKDHQNIFARSHCPPTPFFFLF